MDHLNPHACDAALKEYERHIAHQIYDVGAFFAALRVFKRAEEFYAINPGTSGPPIPFPPERARGNLSHWSPHVQ